MRTGGATLTRNLDTTVIIMIQKLTATIIVPFIDVAKVNCGISKQTDKRCAMTVILDKYISLLKSEL